MMGHWQSFPSRTGYFWYIKMGSSRADLIFVVRIEHHKSETKIIYADCKLNDGHYYGRYENWNRQDLYFGPLDVPDKYGQYEVSYG